MNHHALALAAFARWEALAEDGDCPWNLMHGAALILEVSGDVEAGTWQPDLGERHASMMLLSAIGHACTGLIEHCKGVSGEELLWGAQAGAAPLDEETRAVVERADELIEESHGQQRRSEALREAAGELGVQMDE